MATAILKHIIGHKPQRVSNSTDEDWKKQLRGTAVQLEAQIYQ